MAAAITRPNLAQTLATKRKMAEISSENQGRIKPRLPPPEPAARRSPPPVFEAVESGPPVLFFPFLRIT